MNTSETVETSGLHITAAQAALPAPPLHGTPRCVQAAGAQLGEGLLWSVREQALYWVDILAHRLHRWDPAGAPPACWSFGEEITALAERAQAPGLIVTMRRGFALFDPARDSEPQYLHQPEPGVRGNRFNDGKCDAQGRFWAGSMDSICEAPSGALYRYDPDGRCTRHETGFAITNGPTWSMATANGDGGQRAQNGSNGQGSSNGQNGQSGPGGQNGQNGQTSQSAQGGQSSQNGHGGPDAHNDRNGQSGQGLYNGQGAQINHSGQGRQNGNGAHNGLRPCMYFNDTANASVYRYAFDPASGTLAQKTLWLRFAPEDGLPDGMTTDARGRIWIAHWDGACVTCHDPASGAELARIALPTRQVTNCAFGGRDLRTLFISTARVGMPPARLAAEPLAGGLFAVTLNSPGLAANLFGG